MFGIKVVGVGISMTERLGLRVMGDTCATTVTTDERVLAVDDVFSAPNYSYGS
ncbi:hypothetical protein M0D69_22515 [Caballeronia sp. SEWSISQ10-4 2]|uniref:hypothetical protein n=1 Tax=Caballeronia sp. SEWSISQ10-4 2 TaxID=2937438 RepID=UPI002654534C|nr:hypothetical protein [Caballeronia sp. SEWSISQ10-4 2]MDN7180720.1 hypothetical protein [Caballeronia sp. SEWSISQ10-4 2]